MLKLFYEGSRHLVYFWENDDGSCEAQEYLDSLKNGGHQLQSDYEVLVKRRIVFMAENGPNFRGEECHKLEGSDVAFEFKAPNGSRLGWFYSPKVRGVVICTHGFHKPVSNNAYKPHMQRIEAIRLSHMSEVASQIAQAASEQKNQKGKKK